ncbi:unnamed protein product [Heterobilharzia americana]|nr:unnamed protein product [Heterobilharzia americana]
MNKNLDVKVKDHRRHTLHDQLLSTDNLSNEHNSPRNRHRFLPVDTEYHRADINDRLGIKFSSTKFDWYHTESWLVIQNTIINVILCKSDPDIKASMTNLRQLTTSGVEMSHIIAYCEKKLLRNTMRILRRPLEDLSGKALISQLTHVWKYYIKYSYPVILMIFTVASVSHETVEQMLGVAFLKHIIEKLKFEEAVKEETEQSINPHIRHMFYTLFTFAGTP